MKPCRPAWISLAVAACLIAATNLPAKAATACFAAAKVYRIHPLRGGNDSKDGWSVRGEVFNQCVRRAETADRILRGHYPETIYTLSLASTIGCHNC